MSFVSEFTEADSTNVEVPHVSVFTTTELAASDDATRILRSTL